jgi:hypothetical protein
VVRDGSLIIQNVEENDAGSYMCVASNSEGSETLEIRLTVSAPLSVHVQPTIQTVDLGKPAYLVIIRHRYRSIGVYEPGTLARRNPARKNARPRDCERLRDCSPAGHPIRVTEYDLTLNGK